MSKKQTALVVDDALFMREVIRDALEPLFAEVHTAGTPGDAQVLAERLQPDLITLDLTLDVQEAVQGLDLLASLTASAPKARIMIVSALDQPDIHRQALERGAVACLTKPFSKEGLRTAATGALEDGHGTE